MLRQTDHLANMVDVILDSASVETGAVVVHREELVLSEFLDELKKIARASYLIPMSLWNGTIQRRCRS